jgi:hypothetical protein
MEPAGSICGCCKEVSGNSILNQQLWAFERTLSNSLTILLLNDRHISDPIAPHFEAIVDRSLAKQVYRTDKAISRARAIALLQKWPAKKDQRF